MQPFLSAVTVNGEVISPEAIAAEAQNHPAPKSKPGIAWMAAARALAVRTLLLQEAHRRGLLPTPVQVAEGQVETDDEALIRQLLDETLAPPAPTATDLRAAYDAAPERWRAPTLYEAAHILLLVQPGDAEGFAAAHAQAVALLDEIRRSPRAFDEIARQYSACSSRETGGRLGQLTSGC
jgi:peptidyl-prolyl cis-trans isomerase C